MKSMSILKVICVRVRNVFVNRSILIAENLALRQQLAIQQRTIKRPKLHKWDRIFWVFLSRIWQDWKSALILVKPETVIKWHRQGFKLYWRWKSRTNKADITDVQVPKDQLQLAEQVKLYSSRPDSAIVIFQSLAVSNDLNKLRF